LDALQSSEQVFTVAGAVATQVSRVDLATLGLTERAHLQQWVIAHPELLGPDVLIITFEFDQWATAAGTHPRDRLDVLGLGRDGRLVLAELKRGKAPDTVELQAIKYAAMASRFTEDTLAELHASFVSQQDSGLLTQAEALEKLESHATEGLTPDTLLSPRIVLLAEDFSPTVTASVVWLNEQGVDITLRRYLAYKTSSHEIIVTVSSYYPVPDVATFEVIPRLRSAAQATPEALPEVPWSHEDLTLLRSLPFDVPHAVLDLCSKTPGEWVGASSVYEQAGVEHGSGMGRLAGFGYSVRTRFHRSNPPWSSGWATGGVNQQYYRVDEEVAASWLAVQEQFTPLSPASNPEDA